MKFEYHTLILGAGAAGLTVARLLAQFNIKILLVEKNKFGGDCLNTGCVPSKKFINISKLYSNYHEDIDLEVQKTIAKIAIKDQPEALQALGVKTMLANFKLKTAHSGVVNQQLITFKNLIIATGSKPKIINFNGLENDMYLSSENFWSAKKKYRKVAVIGTGAIGLELGQSLARLGTEVTFIDEAKTILKNFDNDVDQFIRQAFTNKLSISFQLSTKIKNFKRLSDDQIKITLETKSGIEELLVNKIIMATGRESNADQLESAIPLPILKNSFYDINELTLRLKGYRNIFVIGDANGKEMFTHQAGRQAGYIVERYFSPFLKYNATNITWTIYTSPNIAFFGQSQKDLKEKKIWHRIFKYDFADNDRAQIENKQGFLKFFISSNHKILGAILVGHNVSELLAQIAIFTRYNISFQEFRRVNFAYPSLSEVFRDASLAYYFKHVLPLGLRHLLGKIACRH